MIRFVHGSIFDSKVQTLVAPVNCVGVMGKGLALKFRQRWPSMFSTYRLACRSGLVQVGKPFIYYGPDRTIICFPTKDDWRNDSKYEYIEAGLIALKKNYKEWKITSIAMPAIGCGLGGLEWDKVRTMIDRYLGDATIDIEVYEPTLVGV